MIGLSAFLMAAGCVPEPVNAQSAPAAPPVDHYTAVADCIDAIKAYEDTSVGEKFQFTASNKTADASCGIQVSLELGPKGETLFNYIGSAQVAQESVEYTTAGKDSFIKIKDGETEYRILMDMSTRSRSSRIEITLPTAQLEANKELMENLDEAQKGGKALRVDSKGISRITVPDDLLGNWLPEELGELVEVSMGYTLLRIQHIDMVPSEATKQTMDKAIRRIRAQNAPPVPTI